MRDALTIHSATQATTEADFWAELAQTQSIGWMALGGLAAR